MDMIFAPMVYRLLAGPLVESMSARLDELVEKVSDLHTALLLSAAKRGVSLALTATSAARRANAVEAMRMVEGARVVAQRRA
jgi:hypothetical protein